MTAYKATSKNDLSFDVTTNDKTVGRLSYKSWFKYDAVIGIDDSVYEVTPTGFWGNMIEIKSPEKVLLDFKMKWNGTIALQTYFNHIGKDYIFRHKGIFTDTFILTGEEGVELLVIKLDWKWNAMNYQYLITTSDAFEALTDHKEMLLITTLYCANYFLSIMMAGVVPGM